MNVEERVAQGSIPHSVVICPEWFSVTTSNIGLNGEQLGERNGSSQWMHTNILLTPTSGNLWANVHSFLLTALEERGKWVAAEYFHYVSPALCMIFRRANCPDAQNTTIRQRKRYESGNDYFGARYYSSAIGTLFQPTGAKTQIRLLMPI